MSGKGDRQRPAAVSDDVVTANWERIFARPYGQSDQELEVTLPCLATASDIGERYRVWRQTYLAQVGADAAKELTPAVRPMCIRLPGGCLRFECAVSGCQQPL